MKKCEYCAKEISYYEMYCQDECQTKANRFYDLKEKFQKPFSILNGVFVLALGIFLFVYSFARGIGAIGGSVSLMILGITYLFLPFPPEVMIQKYKLQKSIKITRIIAAALLGLGILVMILFLTNVI